MTLRVRSLSLIAGGMLLATSLPTAGCGIGSVRGNGKPSTERYQLTGFDRVHTYGSLDVELALGEVESVEVTCDSNLHEHMEVTVYGGELEFDTDRGVSISPRSTCVATVTAVRLLGVSTTGSGEIRVQGSAPELADVQTSGSGDVRAGDIGSERVDARTTGSGDITLGGVTHYLDVSSTGSGDVNARDLVAQRVLARTNGSGDIAVFAQAAIDAKTTGSGDIDVWGQPPERKHSSHGSGDVKFH
ncbi:MAG: DUF2807 domain-containing protein [Myxococcales bacterium FL481]|nr:MAG: DUF2807 domain-containing protein [Myxococcales bacterium FL481]